MIRRFLISLCFISCFNNAFSQLNLYYGNLHSHTDYTGGVADPITAYNYARNIAQIDILAVTDHNEGLNDEEWDSTLVMANRANLTGGFVALAGYEWTSPGYNHVNVFNTINRVSRFNITDWNMFVQEVIGFGTAFCQFNHPGFIGSNNWNNFTYLNPETDSVFRLIEVRNFDDDQYYIMALDNGWHVSATNNQDNHNADWGNANNSRTGIWAEYLTPESIIEAMHARRTFSTMDKNASSWIDVNGSNMGAVINSGTDLNVHIKLSDTDLEEWKNIQFIGEGGTVLFSINNHSSEIDTFVQLSEQTSKYLFLRAVQTDNDYIWSAPAFINYIGSSICEKKNLLSAVEIFPSPVSENYFVSFSLKEPSAVKIQIVDMAGRIVKVNESNIYPLGFNKVELNRMGVNNGFYILKIESENIIYTKKIIFI